MAQMIAVLSTNLAEVGYDGAAEILFVRFRHGLRLYRYHGVPRSVFEGLLVAPSKGRFVTEHVRDRYPFERVA